MIRCSSRNCLDGPGRSTSTARSGPLHNRPPILGPQLLCCLLFFDFVAVDRNQCIPFSSLVSGSIIRQGEIGALVYATSANACFSETAQLVEEAHTVSHFQKAVLKIGNYLIILAVALVTLIITVAIFRGDPLLATLQFALVLTVAQQFWLRTRSTPAASGDCDKVRIRSLRYRIWHRLGRDLTGELTLQFSKSAKCSFDFFDLTAFTFAVSISFDGHRNHHELVNPFYSNSFGRSHNQRHITKSVCSGILFHFCEIRTTRELALRAVSLGSGRCNLSAVFATLCDDPGVGTALSLFSRKAPAARVASVCPRNRARNEYQSIPLSSEG